jgi:hypothetical protein
MNLVTGVAHMLGIAIETQLILHSGNLKRKSKIRKSANRGKPDSGILRVRD